MADKTHKTIAAALAAAQSQMPKAAKDSQNPHFRSKYADLASVQDACFPHLNANGIAVVQPVEAGEGGYFVRTTLLHESGESLSCIVPLILGKQDMQAFGSAVTYARRYGLMAMAGVAPDDDDGNGAVEGGGNHQPKPKAKQPTKPADNSKAIDYLGEATDLDDLKTRWTNLPPADQRQPDVVAAKDKIKASLMDDAKHDQAVQDEANGIDDEIPY